MRVSAFLRILAAPAVALVLLLSLFSVSYFGYSNLTSETRIAELSFTQIDTDEYLVNLATGDFCEVRSFAVLGDQWRLDASFLKWKYWAAALGFESKYRLDRLEGRYANVAMQNNRSGLSHKLGEPTLLDIARFSEGLGQFNFFADAAYGSSTFHDIDATQIYDVYKTPTGIISRKREHPGIDFQQNVLSIEINNACGSKPGVWFRFSYWLNDLILQWQA
jgi:hypothetical protein